MRALIAGCGYLGTQLAHELNFRGAKVWGINRSQKEGESFESIIWNMLEPKPPTLPDNLDFVIYSVASDSHDEQSYHKAYIASLENLLMALTPQFGSIKRFIFISSTSVYEQENGEEVDEATKVSPRNFPGKISLAAEELVREAFARTTILRCGGIYGPGRDRIIREVISGKVMLEEKPRYTNRIHRDDCALGICHLLEIERVDDLYLFVDDLPADRSEVVSWIARQLNIEIGSASGSSNQGRGASKRCSNKLFRSTGYQFKFPTFREGYASILSSFYSS